MELCGLPRKRALEEGGFGGCDGPPSPKLPSAPSTSAPPPSPLPPAFARDDIQRLPDEILRHMFSFLHPRRRISVEGVCLRWERLALESWKGTRALTMRDFRVRERRHPFTAQDNYSGGLTAYLVRQDLVLKRQVVRSIWARAAPFVDSLDFSGAGTRGNRCNLQYLHASVTWELAQIAPLTLTSVVFERVLVNGPSLAEALGNIRGLRRLILRDSFYENPGQEFSEAMSGLLGRCPQLQELRFTHTTSTCRWLAALPASIQILDLSRTRAPGLRIHAAFDGTPAKFPLLHTLDLANVGMSDSPFHVGFVVRSAPALRVFDIQYIYAEALVEPTAAAALSSLVCLNFFHYDPASQRPFVEALTDERAACRGSLRSLMVNAEAMEADVVARLGTLPFVERLCLGPCSQLKGPLLRALAAAPALQDLILANPRGRDRATSAHIDGDDDDDEDDDDQQNS